MERYQHITRAFKQAPWRSQLQSAAAALLVMVAVMAIGGLYLAGASRWATAGREVQALENRKAVLEIENGELRKQLAQLRSVGQLEARAKALGFVPATSDRVEYLVVTGYPGKGLSSEAPVAGNPAAVEQPVVVRYDETLIDWVARAFSSLSAEASGGG